jgi:hypothetical protein
MAVLRGGPLHLIEGMLDRAQSPILELTDTAGENTVLSCAAHRMTDLRVVRLLISKCPKALMMANKQNNTPLDVASVRARTPSQRDKSRPAILNLIQSCTLAFRRGGDAEVKAYLSSTETPVASLPNLDLATIGKPSFPDAPPALLPFLSCLSPRAVPMWSIAPPGSDPKWMPPAAHALLATIPGVSTRTLGVGMALPPEVENMSFNILATVIDGLHAIIAKQGAFHTPVKVSS